MTSTMTVDLFISVDGWAGSDGLPGYFGYLGPDLAEWNATEMAKPQRVIMGRRTYQALAALPPAAAWGDSEAKVAALEKIVVSRTLESVTWANTRISHDLISEVSALKKSGGVPLRTWGSMSLARQLLKAGLVDRLRIMLFPLFAGDAGREPAFAEVTSDELELVSHRVLDDRLLLIEYRPTGRDIPRG